MIRRKKKRSQSKNDPQKKLTEIGLRLQQLRTAKSMSLDEVAKKTHIQARLLKAIEEGKLETLPEPIYIKGFIRKFAEALGEDGNQVSGQFHADSKTVVDYRKLRWFYIREPQFRPVHLYVLYIVVVMAAVSSLSSMVRRSATQVSSLPESSVIESEFSASPIHENNSTAVGMVQQVVQKSPSQNPVMVEVTLQDEIWLRVVADGKTQFEGVLPEGTQRTWVANEKITLRADNAGGVIIAVNDRQKQRLGTSGQAQEVTYLVDSQTQRQ